MGGPVNVVGDGNASTENGKSDDIGASNPMVYQLVRVNGDGMLIPATDDELIEFEHFGTRQSDNAEVDSKEVVCKEPMDVNGPLFMQPNLSGTHDNGQSSEACSETGKKEEKEAGEGAASETYSSSKPDFSLLKGEICLDNFSIRELQEAFRATFGRYTSINDKLWLKRRIAMGLTNSCDVPSINFFIKDNKIVFNNLKEEDQSRTLNNLPNSGIINMNKATAILNETLEKTLADAAGPVEEMQVLYIKGGEKSLDRCNEDNVNNQMVQCGIKRIRKPTKRYIEELSEVEATECRGRLASLDKISVPDQLIFKSRIKRTCMVDTRQDLLGGYDARMPFVHRGRRRRPRKDFLALMNFVQMEGEKQIPEVLNSEQLSSQGHENYNSSQDDLINENSDPMQTMVPIVRRKHHRAWTLAEVLKLVEGVSRYGAGKWSEIRRVAFASGSHRTSVDLKDKWRNLLKASFSQAPTDKGVASPRKPTSLPIPTPILQRVRELAEKHSHSNSLSHSQSGLEFGSSRFIGNPGIVQEKETGFL